MSPKNQKNLNNILVALSILMATAAGAHADKIWLKNGKTYEGKLLGRSERRFLFCVDADGESVQMSFFPDQVEKLEMTEKTMQEQIPYLKEVESAKFQAKDDKTKFYELSLYDKNKGLIDKSTFSQEEIKKILSKDEREYYEKFDSVLGRYADRFVAVQNLYANLTTATRQDFVRAQKDMDDLYFELNNMAVPEMFAKSHALYLDSVKSSYLAFNALGQGLLDQASALIKSSEDAKKNSMLAYREAMLKKKDVSKNETQNSQ